jgi:N-dimethylarginine dimethylaminohydrolase
VTGPSGQTSNDAVLAGAADARPARPQAADAVDRHWGVGSMVSRLRRVLVRTPTTDGDFGAAGWPTPDPGALVSEHGAFVDLLRRLGCRVEIEPAAPGLVDACYTHDPVITTPCGAIVLQMRKPVRRPEPALTRAALDRLGVPILGELDGTARTDGGDKVWLDPRTLLVGRGHRTNAAAVDQLRALLQPRGVMLEVFDLPNYRGDVEVLHLMSVISLVRDDLAVVFRPLIPVRLLELLAARGVDTIAVDEAEFETQGGNVLAVAPGVAVIAAGNPRVRDALLAAGCQVHEFAGDTVALAGTGGPTCLTLPLWRED